MTAKQYWMVVLAAFWGGLIGGGLIEWGLSAKWVHAQKTNGVHAEEFLLLDAAGKARGGLGLDANGEIGLVLTSKDGSRTLRFSPDERIAIQLTERGGRLLWGAP